MAKEEELLAAHMIVDQDMRTKVNALRRRGPIPKEQVTVAVAASRRAVRGYEDFRERLRGKQDQLLSMAERRASVLKYAQSPKRPMGFEKRKEQVDPAQGASTINTGLEKGEGGHYT